MLNEAVERKKIPEFEVPSRSVAIVAPTSYPQWYPGEIQDITHTQKVRGDLALETARSAQGIGYQLTFVDGNSSHPFREELEKLGVEVLDRIEPTRAAARRLGFQHVAQKDNVKAVLFTQPEKVSLIADCTQQIAKPLVQGTADIVVPKRNEQLFKRTYPDYMVDSEIKANDILNKIVRSQGLWQDTNPNIDWFSGPVAFRNTPDILGLFMEKYAFVKTPIGMTTHRRYAEPDKYSDAAFFPIIKALMQDPPLRVASVEVPFRYPEKQRENERIDDPDTLEGFMERRKAQRMGIVTEVIHYIHLQRNDGKSRLKPI